MGFEKVILKIEGIGHYIIQSISLLGKASIFIIESTVKCFLPPYYFNVIIKNFMEIGFFSLPMVSLTSIFTGAVLILQNSLNSHAINITDIMPGIVVMSITRELGPVLIALILAGRVGAATAAEIGTMRITDQIDALIVLDTDPIKYLVSPRILSYIAAMPLLIICADLLGVFGGYLVAVYELNYNADLYIKNTINFFNFSDVILGLIKSIVFGFIIALMSCYCGYYCQGSARGVGLATTSAVVLSSVFIIFLNYIITFFYI